MKQRKKFSRKKTIVATNVSDILVNEIIRTTNIRQLAKDTGISEYILRKAIDGAYVTNIVRSKTTNKLWQIECEYEYVVMAIPVGQDVDTEKSTHKFTSVYKCCKFLGISSRTYYARYKEQPLGEPCANLITDIFERQWQLVFLKEIKNKDNWRFVQNENS